MLTKMKTDFVVTDDTKKRIQARLSEPSPYPPIAALLLSKDMSSNEPYWTVSYYDHRVVEGPDFIGLLIEASGLHLVLPQPNIIDALSGMQLEWDGSRFLVKAQ